MSLKCDCGGTFKPKTLARLNLEPFTGIKLWLSKVPGVKCAKCGHETVHGTVLNFILNTLALELAKAPFRLDGPSAKYLRKRLGRTQSELAAIIGVDRVTVAKWETTETIAPHPDFILKTKLLQQFVAWKMLPASALLDLPKVRREIPRHPDDPAMVEAILSKLRTADVATSRMARIPPSAAAS